MNNEVTPRRVLALAVPVMLSNASVPLVGLADMAVMGRMGSPAYLSAVAIGAILFSSIFWVFGFLRMGTGGLVAQSFGADDRDAVTAHAWRAIAIGLSIGVLLFALQKPLLRAGLALIDTGDWGELVTHYFSIRILAAPATLATYALIDTLIGCQRMGGVLVLQLVLNLGNVALNIALFSFTELGIRGVALATVLAEWLTLLLGFWLLRDMLRSGTRLRRYVIDTLLEAADLRRFFQIGGDLFIRTLGLTAAFYWMTVVGSRQGVAILAANAILLQMLHLMAHWLDGFAHAAETLVGQAIGKREPDTLRQAVRTTTALALPLAAVFALLFALAGGSLIDLLSTDENIRALARNWLPWIALGPLVGIWSFLLDGIFIGATETRAMRNGMLVSLFAFIAATFAFVPLIGNHGLWLSYHVLMVARAATLGPYYTRVLRRAA